LTKVVVSAVIPRIAISFGVRLGIS